MRRASAQSAKIVLGMAVNTLTLSVQGMSCGNCARGIEKKLGSVPGVTQSHVDLAAAKATVEYDTDLVTPEAIASAVRDLGYETP